MTRTHLLDCLRIALICAVGLVALPLSLGAASEPVPGAPVLVVAAPWNGGAARVVAQARGREIGPVRAPLAVMAILDDTAAARQAGAWMILNAGTLAAICGVAPAMNGPHS